MMLPSPGSMQNIIILAKYFRRRDERKKYIKTLLYCEPIHNLWGCWGRGLVLVIERKKKRDHQKIFRNGTILKLLKDQNVRVLGLVNLPFFFTYFG